MTSALAHAVRAALPGLVVASLDLRTGVDAGDVADRADAVVHVGDAWVLVGPWGPGGLGRRAGARACGQCVRLRWSRIRSDAERAVLTGRDVRGGEAGWPLAPAFALDAVVAAVRAAQEAADRADPGPGRAHVTALDLATLTPTTVRVETDPLCPACTDGNRPVTRAVVARPKPDPVQLRLRPLSAYDIAPDAMINPWCGAVSARAHDELASTTTAPVAGRLSGRSGAHSTELAWSGQRTDYASSRVVGVLEGLERYAGSLARTPSRSVTASFDELAAAGRHPVDPYVIGLYADATYAAEAHLTPFDPAAPMPWLPAWSLRDRETVLVAERNVHYDGTSGPDRFVDECSNGCASGSCREEAVLHGLLEVIERDAFVLGWYRGSPLPVIDIGPELGADVLTMIARARLYGYDVTLLDNRSDLSVPVVTALARRRDGGDGYLVLASGASLDPLDAVRSALDEVLTYLPARGTQVSRRRSELGAMLEDFGRVRELRDHPELFGLPESAPLLDGYVDAHDHAPLGERFGTYTPRADLTEDLRALVAELAALGHDTVVVDQTSPEQARAGLSAARVIVPGLLPIDFGWSRQRALGMPRLLSRTDAPRLVPHPFP